MRSKSQLFEFAMFVAEEVTSPSFDECPEFFAEVACRKLAKMGIIKEQDGNWVYEKEQR